MRLARLADADLFGTLTTGDVCLLLDVLTRF